MKINTPGPGNPPTALAGPTGPPRVNQAAEGPSCRRPHHATTTSDTVPLTLKTIVNTVTTNKDLEIAHMTNIAHPAHRKPEPNVPGGPGAASDKGATGQAIIQGTWGTARAMAQGLRLTLSR